MNETETSPKMVDLYCVCGKQWQIAWKPGYVGGYIECRDCKTKRRTERFKETCPSLFQESDPKRLGKPFADAQVWKYGPKGLMLFGATGNGKTRAAWALIRRLMIEEGREVMVFDSTSFGHAMERAYAEGRAAELMESAAKVELLFLDDFGKLKLTERAEAELFGIIDRRMAWQLPCIITTNDHGESLAARLTDNRGPALVRRLREFCQVIQF
jgi:DNA replication protein DnaC